MKFRKRAVSLLLAGTLATTILAPTALAGDGYGGYRDYYDVIPDTAAEGYIATAKAEYGVDSNGSSSPSYRETYETDSTGKLLKYADPEQTTIFQYDGNGKLIGLDCYGESNEYYPDGHYGHSDLTYDVKNNVVSEECDWYGTRVHYNYSYDSKNRLIKSDGVYYEENEALNEHTEIWEYDSKDNLISYSDLWDNDGEIKHYAYDAGGNLIKETFTYTYEDEIYDGSTYTYDGQGRLLTETADGSTKTYKYDDQGKLKSIIEEDGDRTTYEYDSAGNLVRESEYWDGDLSYYTVYSYKKLGSTDANVPHVGQFTDVLTSAYYADAVKWAVDKGIVAGTSDSTFSPNRTCTRAEVMTMLWNAMGRPNVNSSKNPFTDVPSDTWYAEPILWAYQNGITSGTSTGKFSPSNGCTRAQVMTFIWNMKGKPAASNSLSFADVKSTDYYYNAVKWAVANGVTSGTTATTFSPNQSCTRAQIVTFLYKAMA